MGNCKLKALILFLLQFILTLSQGEIKSMNEFRNKSVDKELDIKQQQMDQKQKRSILIKILDSNEQKCIDFQILINEIDSYTYSPNSKSICDSLLVQINKQSIMQTYNYYLSPTLIKEQYQSQLCQYSLQKRIKDQGDQNENNCSTIQNYFGQIVNELDLEQLIKSFSIPEKDIYTCKCIKYLEDLFYVDLFLSRKIVQKNCCAQIMRNRIIQSSNSSFIDNSEGNIISEDTNNEVVYVSRHFRIGLGNLGFMIFISHTIMYFALQGDDKDHSVKKESIFDQPYAIINRQQSQIQESRNQNVGNPIPLQNQNQQNQLHQNDDQQQQLNQQNSMPQVPSLFIIRNHAEEPQQNHNQRDINILNTQPQNVQIDIENRSRQQSSNSRNENRVFPAQSNQNNRMQHQQLTNQKILFLHPKYAYYKKVENTPRWMRVFFIFLYMSIFQMIHSIIIQQTDSSSIYLFIAVNGLTWIGVYLYSGIFYLIFYILSPHNREENKCSKYFVMWLIYIINLLFVASNYYRTKLDHNNLFYWPFLYFIIDQYAIDYIFLYISMKYSFIRYAKLFSIKASPNQ